MTVGFNFTLGIGAGTTPPDFDPTKFDPIVDENGKIIGYKPKKDKTENVNHLKEENKGDTVEFSTTKNTNTEEQAKVEKTNKNVQKEFDKVTKEINIEDISKDDQAIIADAEQKMKKMEDPTVSSYKVVLISQTLLKNLDDVQQNTLNTMNVEAEIKKDAEEKDTTVTGINKDFGFLTSAYKTFGAFDTEVDETDMDLVG